MIVSISNFHTKHVYSDHIRIVLTILMLNNNKSGGFQMNCLLRNLIMDLVGNLVNLNLVLITIHCFEDLILNEQSFQKIDLN